MPEPVGTAVSDVSAPGAPAAMTVPDVAMELPVYQLAAALGFAVGVNEPNVADTGETAMKPTNSEVTSKMDVDDAPMAR